jgi:hypothetical protein
MERRGGNVEGALKLHIFDLIELVSECERSLTFLFGIKKK